MFRTKKQDKDKLSSMQELYNSITNLNWAAMSLEQNGHYKHAFISWKDLNIYADKAVQKLNEESLNASLSGDEKVLLDELNKIRAEIESSYHACTKTLDRYYQQQQQQQQQQAATSVPTLRSHVPHTIGSRKQGTKLMKSLRPGGITAYSTSSPSSPSVHTSHATLAQDPNSSSAKQAANIIWAPSSSLNVSNISSHNNSSSSLTPVEPNTIEDNGSPIHDFAEFSSTTTILPHTQKRTPSDRAKAALKASAAVKFPNRPDLKQKSGPNGSNSYIRSVHHHKTSHSTNGTNRNNKSRSRSPQCDSASPSRSASPSHSPYKLDNGVEDLEDEHGLVEPGEDPHKPHRNSLDDPKGNDEAPITDDGVEEDADEKILKKIKGVDLRFAKNILIESERDQDKVYWSDIAGLEQAKESLLETVVYPFLRPDLFRGLREPVSGMLLFGPPGTGKTMLARAAATESNSTFFSIQSSSLTSKWYGESEKLVRALFQVAKAKAPSIIFVDEIDSLLGKRSGDGDDDTSRRLKNEFLVQWSDLSKAAAGRVDDDDSPPPRVLVLAATNLPWGIDEAARRRFVRRQYIPLPEPETRMAHFKKLLSNTENSLTEEDMDKLVELTEGYSGSDITSLAKDAAIWPIRELGSKMLNLKEVEIRPMSLGDFEKSMKNIRPSVNKEGLDKFETWAKEFGSSGA